MSMDVVVVEDDAAIRKGIVGALEYAGYAVTACADGESAVDLCCRTRPDLVILDLMLPGMDGFAVLAELRRVAAELPVIIVTARGAEDDRVRGLEEGADDYVVKPFSARELLARANAVLRRSPERSSDVGVLRRDDVTIDLRRRTVVAADERRTLAERDVEILRYLAVCRGRAVDRQELLHRVWGVDPRGLHTRTVDMQIARLRDKLAIAGDGAFIETVRHKGYMLAHGVAVDEE